MYPAITDYLSLVFKIHLLAVFQICIMIMDLPGKAVPDMKMKIWEPGWLVLGYTLLRFGSSSLNLTGSCSYAYTHIKSLDLVSFTTWMANLVIDHEKLYYFDNNYSHELNQHSILASLGEELAFKNKYLLLFGYQKRWIRSYQYRNDLQQKIAKYLAGLGYENLNYDSYYAGIGMRLHRFGWQLKYYKYHKAIAYVYEIQEKYRNDINSNFLSREEGPQRYLWENTFELSLSYRLFSYKH